MFSVKSILAAAATFAIALAQTPNVGFEYVPPVAVAGKTYNITWGGGDGTSVTLTLREGNPLSLDTIGVLASNVKGNYYLWTVDSTLPTASDYALQITQGLNGINYSGEFSIVGGTGTSSLSYSGLTSSTSSANGTMVTAAATMTKGTAASMGTGTTMARNMTFSSASLSTASVRTTSGTASHTGSASTTSSTSPPTSNDGTSMGSSAALVMGLFGAIMFLQ